MAKKGSAVKSGGRRAGISSKVKLRAEDELEITVEFLRLVNEARSTDELVRAAATFFQQKSGCEVLGIRLKQGEDYPYYIARGFSPEFLERENHLCARSKDGKTLYDREGFPIYECVCGNVVCGRFNPSKPFYSAKGSFWTNSTSELVTVATEEDLMAKIRGRCVENFESVAVICIRQGEETLGLLHINDRRKGMFSPEIITRWERLADQLAVALAKFRAEDELRKARDTLEATVEQRTAELHKSESLLAKSQEMAHIGSWELDVKTGDINRSTESYRIFGAAPGEPKIDYGDFISFILPGDRERVDALIQSSLETGQPYTVTYNIKRKDGQVRTIMSYGEAVRDGSGQIVRMYGTNQDITDLKRAEEKLLLTQFAVDHFTDSSIWLNPAGEFIYVNNTASQKLGYAPDELMSMKIWDVDPNHPYDKFREVWGKIKEKGAVQFESIHVRKDGSSYPVEVSANYLKFDHRECMVTFDRDITERKRMEEKLVHVASFPEQNPNALFEVNEAGVITYSNPAANQLFPDLRAMGMDHPILKGIAADVFNKDEKSELIREVQINDTTYLQSIYCRHDTKTLRIYLRDITERKRAEEALKSSETMLKLVMDNTPQCIFWKDINSVYLGCNSAFARLTGVGTSEHIIGKTDYDLSFTKEQADSFRGYDRQVMSTGLPVYHILETFKDANGRQGWADTNKVPLFDSEGNVIGVMGTYEDITERRRVEEALRESEERFRALADNIPNLVWMANADGWIFWYNKQWYDYTGTTLEEMQGWGWQKVHHPDYVKSVTEEWSSRIKAGQPYDNVFPLRGKDGNYRWFLTRVTPIRDAQGNIQRWFGTNTDITERKRTEEALRESEERLRMAQQVARIGTFEWNIQTGVNMWTPELEAMYGLPRGGFPGTQDAWENLIYEEDRAGAVGRVSKAIDKGSFEGEWRVVWPDGTFHWLYGRGWVFKDDSGKPLRLIGINIDITERKQGEKELEDAKAEAELYLDLMGHDIRNMNMIGMGFLELAMGSPDIKNEDKAYLLKSLGSLENSTRLIDNVRKLQKARSGELEHQEVDACQMFMRVLAHYSNMPGVKVSFNYDIPPSCLVRADELLYEVFENVVGNAIKHGGSGPVIDVRFDQFAADGRTYNRFIVEDNGPGIPDARKDRIFNRLQRGDSKAKGTGLGLYLVKSLVESYGGRVSVEDRVLGDHAKGAKFVVMLPTVNQ